MQSHCKQAQDGRVAEGTALDLAADAEADALEWQGVAAGHWPFQGLCDKLCLDILDPRWEVRHGAAVALREVLHRQANFAGVAAPVMPQPTGAPSCS